MIGHPKRKTLRQTNTSYLYANTAHNNVLNANVCVVFCLMQFIDFLVQPSKMLQLQEKAG